MKNSQYNFIMAYLSLILMLVGTLDLFWAIMAGFWSVMGIINTFTEL